LADRQSERGGGYIRSPGGGVWPRQPVSTGDTVQQGDLRYGGSFGLSRFTTAEEAGVRHASPKSSWYNHAALGGAGLLVFSDIGACGPL